MATDDGIPDAHQGQTMAVGCFCFPWAKKDDISKSRSIDYGDYAGNGDGKKSKPSTRRSTMIFHGTEGGLEPTVKVEVGDIDLAFFDAVESALGDDEYPIITTSFIPKSKKVSFMQPETMLRDSAFSDWGSARFEDARSEPTEGGDVDELGRLKDGVEVPRSPSPPPIPLDVVASPSPAHGSNKISSSTSGPGRAVSFRRVLSVKIFRRGSMAARKDLESPMIKVQERGYPGQLTAEELLQCQMFYREIHKRKGFYLEIVYALDGIEEEPYAICRFMRATKFESSKMLERLENSIELWADAKTKNFYYDIDAALGAPLVLFLQHYPYLYQGNAKNGCPVNYFKAGKLQTEALLSLVSPDLNSRYFWHTFFYTFKEKMREAKARHPDFVRCESINVMDLKGLSSSQLTNEAFDCLKSVSKIADFFPETLHCMVIINAPSWFSFTWTIIKSLIDPRTAKKIEVYSNEDKGHRRLSELVAISEIPSDFGGFGPSLEESIRERCKKPGDNRDHYSQLIHVSKKNSKQEDLYDLAVGDTAIIRVHSRSVSGATVSIFADGKKVVTETVSRLEPNNDGSQPGPKVTEIAKDLKGPGKLVVEVKGLNDASSGKLSSGNFLVSVEVVKSS